MKQSTLPTVSTCSWPLRTVEGLTKGRQPITHRREPGNSMTVRGHCRLPACCVQVAGLAPPSLSVHGWLSQSVIREVFRLCVDSIVSSRTYKQGKVTLLPNPWTTAMCCRWSQTSWPTGKTACAKCYSTFSYQHQLGGATKPASQSVKSHAVKYLIKSDINKRRKREKKKSIRIKPSVSFPL